jgi:hypothetical protein
VLLVGVAREEAEAGPRLEREAPERVGRRRHEAAPRSEESRRAAEGAGGRGEVLEDREHQDRVVRGAREDLGRRLVGVEVPRGERRRGVPPAHLGEDDGVAVTPDVRREPGGQIGQAAAEVEEPGPGGNVRKRRRQPGALDAPRQEAEVGREACAARVRVVCSSSSGERPAAPAVARRG